MDAVSIRNWATSVQLPAATSCSSLSNRETNDNTTAVTNEATATVYSIVLLLFISIKYDLHLLWSIPDVCIIASKDCSSRNFSL